MLDTKTALSIIKKNLPFKRSELCEEAWQTLKAHCTQPTDVQQANTAIALAERYCDSCLSHSAEERMTMFRFTMWVREQQQ